MKHRMLGKTGIEASEIGLGTEWLAKKQPQSIVQDVIQAAIDGGVNYFDVLVLDPAFLQAAGGVFQKYRDSIFISGHFGIGIVKGKTTRVRKVEAATNAFHEMLEHLGIDRVDITMLEYVSEKEYPKFTKANGLIDAQKELRNQGLTRFLGLSSHDLPVLSAGIKSGTFDVIMTQVNAACSAIPGRHAVYIECKEAGVGLIAIKTMLGGRLFRPGRKTRIAYYQTATETIELKTPPGITPIRCISHVLAQPGVSVCIVGAQTVPEMQASLDYVTATAEERDDTPLVELFRKK